MQLKKIFDNQKILDVILKWYILIFILIQLFFTVPFMVIYVSKIQTLMVIIGLVLCFFMLPSILRKHKNIVSKTLMIFLFWYFIVIIINYKIGFISNIKLLGYMAIQFIVFFNYRDNLEKFVNKLIVTFNIVILTMTLVSLFLVINQLGYIYIYNNTAYTIGISANRLVGIFGNPNVFSAISCIALFLSLYCLEFDFKNQKTHFLNKGFNAFCIVIYAFCLMWCNSRGILLSLAIGLPIYALFKIWKKSLKFKIIIIPILCIFNVLAFPVLSRKLCDNLSFISKSNYYIENNTHNSNTQNNVPNNPASEIETEERISGSNSQRVELFQLGFKVFKSNMVFGVTVNNIGIYANNFIEENSNFVVDDPILSNPHNTIIQILAASGIVGFAIIAVFAFLYLKTFNNIFDINNKIHIVIFPLVVTLLINCMLEWYIFFNASFIACMFWFLSGQVIISKRGAEYGK